MQTHYAVILDPTKAKTKLPDKLKKIGVKVYTWDRGTGHLSQI